MTWLYVGLGAAVVLAVWIGIRLWRGESISPFDTD